MCRCDWASREPLLFFWGGGFNHGTDFFNTHLAPDLDQEKMSNFLNLNI